MGRNVSEVGIEMTCRCPRSTLLASDRTAGNAPGDVERRSGREGPLHRSYFLDIAPTPSVQLPYNDCVLRQSTSDTGRVKP